MTGNSTNSPALSVLGVDRAHAKRAMRWLEKRSLLSFYRPVDNSLNAFEFRQGRDWTYAVLHKALAETR
jgi:hypothetical protein